MSLRLVWTLLSILAVASHALNMGVSRQVPIEHTSALPSYPPSLDYLPECVHALLGKYDVPEAKVTLPGIDAIFVLHYPASGRGPQMWESLKKANITEAVTIVDFLNKDVLANMTQDELHCIFNPRVLNHPHFTEGQRSASIKHLWVKYHIVRNGYKNAIVMEDDPWFGKRSADRLLTLGDEVAKLGSYSAVMLGGCYGMHPNLKNKGCENLQVTDHLYGPGLRSRCAHGYLISYAGAKTVMMKCYEKDDQGRRTGLDRNNPDEQMDATMVESGGYWYEPPLWTMTQQQSLLNKNKVQEKERNPCIQNTVRGKDREPPSDE